MSSSCRSGKVEKRLRAIGLWGAVSIGAAGAVQAQETYFVPLVSASAEYNTNRQLNPTDEQSGEGYRASLEGYLKRNTERTTFFLHPLVSYQDFPDIKKLKSVEAMVEAQGEHRTLRGNYGFTARYTRQDTLNAEIGRAAFDTVDPNAPDTEGTGVVTGGITRNRYEAQPNFSYSVSQLVDIEGDARWDSVKYQSDLPGERVGYEAPGVSMRVLRAFGPRVKLGVGPYYEHFKSDDDLNETESYGADIDFRYQWSKITRTNLVLSVEKSDVKENGVSDSVTTWGLRWVGLKRNRVGSFRYSLGRFLQPSSVGTRARVDQVRAEWVRPLSPRLLFDIAGRYTRLRALGDSASSVGRNRANGDLSLRWLMTETVSLAGGYRYSMLDRLGSSFGTVENHGVFLSLVWSGRDPHPDQR